MSQSQHPQTGSYEILVQSPSLVTTDLWVCFIILPIIATLSIIVRVHCQHKNSQALKADDWMIALGLVRSTCLLRKWRLSSLIYYFFQLMSWAQAINIFVAAKKDGIDTTTMSSIEAMRTYLLARDMHFPLIRKIC